MDRRRSSRRHVAMGRDGHVGDPAMLVEVLAAVAGQGFPLGDRGCDQEVGPLTG